MEDHRLKLDALNRGDRISKCAMALAVASFLCLWPLGLVSLALGLWARKYGENPRTTQALWMSAVALSIGVLHFVSPSLALVLSAAACAWGGWLLYRMFTQS
jgi:xanthine/uracil/vitamin C permease (AzgA family)